MSAPWPSQWQAVWAPSPGFVVCGSIHTLLLTQRTLSFYSSWCSSIPICQHLLAPLACCGSTGKLYYSENDVTDFLRFPWSPQSVASADCQNDHLLLGSCPYIDCCLTCHFTGSCNVLYGHNQSSPQGISVQRKDPGVPWHSIKCWFLCCYYGFDVLVSPKLMLKCNP